MRAPIDFYSAFASYFARNIYLCCTFAKVSKPELCFKSFSICSFFGNKSSSWYLFLFWFCWSISYNQYDTGKFIYKKVHFLVLETNDISSFSLQICDHRCYLIFQMLLQMRTIIYVEKNLLPPFSLVRYKPEFLDSNPKLLPNRRAFVGWTKLRKTMRCIASNTCYLKKLSQDLVEKRELALYHGFKMHWNNNLKVYTHYTLIISQGLISNQKIFEASSSKASGVESKADACFIAST